MADIEKCQTFGDFCSSNQAIHNTKLISGNVLDVRRPDTIIRTLNIIKFVELFVISKLI